MSYNFESRHDYLRGRMRKLNSRTVTYERGSASGTIKATVYEADPSDLQPFGVSLEVRHFFFVIDLTEGESVAGADYAYLQELLGADEVPERNDEITDEALGLVFRVEPMGDEPPFRYTNHQRKAVRLHAVEVGEAVTGSGSGSG